MRITEAGVYVMDSAKYLADPCPAPSLNNGTARTILAQSEAHAWEQHPRLNPSHIPEHSQEFDLGLAAHALIVEGEDRMVACAFDNWRTKAAQEARDEARAAGKHPLLTRHFDAVYAMRGEFVKALATCDDLSGMTLASVHAEQTLIWKEGETWLRVRPDLVTSDWRVVLDFKTTTDAQPASFGRQLVRMGYDFQDAFYSRGIEHAFGNRPKFIFAAQEKEKPYAVSFHGCAPSLVTIAAANVEESIQRWTHCLKTGIWRPYSPRIHWHEATTWQMAEHEERVNGIEQEGESYGKMMAVK